ncbi:MAG: hypothetical protein J6B36_08650 [Muribaculaceae bacterium]|nr:hypothetical protein [Muribaculaceae bacterium]
MNYNIFDLYTSAVTGALALVLIFVTMPGNDQWRPFRRMNRLLVACCVVMCVANLVTSLLNVEDTGGIEMRVSMLIVSMYCKYSLKSGPVAHSKMGHPREYAKLIKED